VADLDPAIIRDVMLRQRIEGEERLANSGTELESVIVSYVAEMSYLGQIHTLRVPVDPAWSPARIIEAFEAVYRLEYGNTLGSVPTVLVGLKTAVQGVRRKPATAPARHFEAKPAVPRTHRQVYFSGWISTPIFDRRDLEPGMTFEGPAIIEQADTTTVIEPDMSARVDPHQNVLIEVI